MLHYVYMSIFSKHSYLRETRNIKIDGLLERHAFQIETYLCSRIQNFFEFTFQFWIYNYQEWHYCEMHKVKPLLFLFSNNWKLQVFQCNQNKQRFISIKYLLNKTGFGYIKIVSVIIFIRITNFTRLIH